MNTSFDNLHPITTDLAVTGGRLPERKDPRQRPKRGLPTDRLKFDVQQRLLRAYATLSGAAHRPVTSDALARSVGVSAGTAGLCNNFFLDSGWIERKGKGQYAATDALVEHNNRWAVDSGGPTAWEPLRAPMSQSWYWQVLGPMLGPAGATKRDARIVLMGEAGASGEHLRALDNILDWLELVGMIWWDGDRLMASLSNDGSGEVALFDDPVAERPPAAAAAAPANAPAAHAEVPQSTTEAPGQPGVFLSFNFHVWLGAADLERLQPDQIRATFDVASKLGALAERSA